MSNETVSCMIESDMFSGGGINSALESIQELVNLVGTEYEVIIPYNHKEKFKFMITQEMIDKGYFNKISNQYSEGERICFYISRPLSPYEIEVNLQNIRDREERDRKEYERLALKYAQKKAEND